jgi:hypothetical protein
MFVYISNIVHGKKIRVADPDPNWIQIQSGQWIQIRIVHFFPIFGYETLDSYWTSIRIGIQPQVLDPGPDPQHMNTDPQPLEEMKIHTQCYNINLLNL